MREEEGDRESDRQRDRDNTRIKTFAKNWTGSGFYWRVVFFRVLNQIVEFQVPVMSHYDYTHAFEPLAKECLTEPVQRIQRYWHFLVLEYSKHTRHIDIVLRCSSLSAFCVNNFNDHGSVEDSNLVLVTNF